MESLKRIITRFSKEELGQIGPLLEEAEPPPPLPPLSPWQRLIVHIHEEFVRFSSRKHFFVLEFNNK
jgi:hypothetical protein